MKRQKSWVPVGISPFGIWRPGVPDGIEAGIDSYEQLAGDSRKWLKNGWVDCLAPQLNWKISPQKQSFTTLLNWWRQQGSRPVWPGIASARIGGPEDGRPASEIIAQIDQSRRIGKNWNGHIHWSAKSLVKNQGGIATKLATTYTQPAAVPPMPWVSSKSPAAPGVSASADGNGTTVRLGTRRQHRKNRRPSPRQRQLAHRPNRALGARSIIIPRAEAFAITALDRFGNARANKILGLK